MGTVQEKVSKGGELKNSLLLALNTIMLLANIVLVISNIRFRKVELKNSSMEVTERFPQFEISYLEIWKEAFKELDRTGLTDSLYTDAFMNFHVANSEAISFKYDSQSQYETVTSLSIKQIGGSVAKDVTIEFDCLTAEAGLDYFVTTGPDVLALDEMDQDVAGNTITKKTLTINYGDLPSGKGLIIPLFEVSNLRNKDVYDSEEFDEDVWSLTGPVILVPKVLRYNNIYNNKITTQEIRKMNNSSITYSLYVEGRG